MGCHCPSMYCCSTAPTVVLEALVMTLVRACGFGWTKVADARVSLTVKMACIVEYHPMTGAHVPQRVGY